MRRFRVERVTAADLASWGTTCNTNNHPKDPDDIEARDMDYRVEVSRTNLSRYRHLIDYPVAWEYDLTVREAKILGECCASGFLTGRVPAQYEEEMAEIAERMQAYWPEKPDGYFFRFDSASPKDGVVGFPVRNAAEAVRNIATSKRAMRALENGERSLFFANFDKTWDENREFRVFVRNGRVTAVSQYVPWRPCVLSERSDEEVANTTRSMVRYLEEDVLPSVLPALGTNDVVADTYACPDGTFRVVEFNSFGYWLASGSALFHWLEDRAVLYGPQPENGVVVRIVKT